MIRFNSPKGAGTSMSRLLDASQTLLTPSVGFSYFGRY